MAVGTWHNCRQLVWSSWRLATKCFQNSPSKAGTVFRFTKGGGQWKLQHKLQTQLHRAQRWRRISQPCSTEAGASQKQCLISTDFSHLQVKCCITSDKLISGATLRIYWTPWMQHLELRLMQPQLIILYFIILISRILYMAYITDQFTSLIYQNSYKWNRHRVHRRELLLIIKSSNLMSFWTLH